MHTHNIMHRDFKLYTVSLMMHASYNFGASPTSIQVQGILSWIMDQEQKAEKYESCRYASGY